MLALFSLASRNHGLHLSEQETLTRQAASHKCGELRINLREHRGLGAFLTNPGAYSARSRLRSAPNETKRAPLDLFALGIYLSDE